MVNLGFLGIYIAFFASRVCILLDLGDTLSIFYLVFDVDLLLVGLSKGGLVFIFNCESTPFDLFIRYFINKL